MPLKINGSTSGSVTLAAPATGSDVTLTLPGTTMDLASELAAKANKVGSVLQVVQSSTATEATSSSSTYADTGLSASITPTASTSKILVIVHQSGLEKRTNNTGVNLRLLRGATVLAEFEKAAGVTDTTTGNNVAGAGITWLDSPATTSAVTYKTQFASYWNNARAAVQYASSTSTITLMEIGAA